MAYSERIAIITAEYPDIPAGVGDYSYKIKQALEKQNIEVFIITSKDPQIRDGKKIIKIDWNIKSVFKIWKIVKQKKLKTIILQYPSPFYGRANILPLLYPIEAKFLKTDFFVTLHEFSNINPIRRIFELLLVILAKKVIVTTEEEKGEILKILGRFFGKKIFVINIGSNIPRLNQKPNNSSKIITFFGLFYPKKCSTRIVDIMEEINKTFPKEFIFRFVGGTSIFHKKFFNKIKSYAEKKLDKTEWFINNPLEKVGNFLKDSFCAVVIYNDGASLRRGTLLALISNGIPVITNRGKQSRGLKNIENRGVFFIEKNEEAIHIIEKLKSDKKFYNYCFNNLKTFSKRFDFNNIAKEYIRLIKDEPI